MLFSDFIGKYPESQIAKTFIEFEGNGFDKGQHGDFAKALWFGDVVRALAYADVENTNMLHDLLFPAWLEAQCECCERIDPDDFDPSDYCNEGYQ